VIPVFIRAVPWVPERVDNAHHLRRKLKAKIVWDTNRDGASTMVDALRVAAGTAAIHMEDDVVLAPCFREQVEASIADRPDMVIQFFSWMVEDLTEGSREADGRGFRCTPCFYIPERMSHPLSVYMGANREIIDRIGWDYTIGKYLGMNKERYFIHIPSLVEHRSWTSAVRPGRSTRRKSTTFGGQTL
jgi:hypothetical protein